MPKRLSDRWIIALLVCAGVLLLSNLDNGYLWQDEAETALLARNTLKFGYPRGFDGRNYIEITPFGYGPHEAWIYSPWLPFYLLAGVFAVAGESTWVARFPFAIFGLVSICLTWRLAAFLTQDHRIQRLSVALLTCSVPFLLHMRQCRYYALTVALMLGASLSYLRFLTEPSRKWTIPFALVMVLLFHTNFGTFIPVLLAVIVHQGIWGTQATRERTFRGLALVGVLTLPWALWFYRPAFVGSVSLGRLYHHLEYYVRVTNKYLVPLAAMGILSGVLMLMKRRPRWAPWRLTRSRRAFLLVLVAAYVVFLAIPDQRHMRYLIPLLPVLVIGEAWWLAGWYGRSRMVGMVLTILVLFTNVLQSVHPRIPMAGFLYELTHRYTGPMEGIVSYLQVHAQPDQVVKIPYDDRTLMFYTDLRVERPSQFLSESYPDWVVIRRDWIPSEFFTSDYFHRLEASYQRIELPAPDILWQNREDPGSHHFRTVEDAPHVVIYRKPGLRHG